LEAAANAVDLLVSLGRAGIQPDLLASTTCLGACVASGKMDLALKVFEARGWHLSRFMSSRGSLGVSVRSRLER
jgi:hypothetical protein